MASRYLTVEEAAAYLRISEGTLRNWRTAGTAPPAHRAGNRVLFLEDDLDRWIAAQSDPLGSRSA